MKIRNMVLSALFAALLAVCAWISIPAGDVAFTLQTFGVFLTLLLLGGKRGTVSISVYLLLGAVGLPVFSGFRGGIGTLLGVTGGYMVGFLFTCLVYWLITSVAGSSKKIQLTALLAGLAVCYLFGSLWFYILYLNSGSSISLGVVFAKCVLPYLLPDGAKLALAWFLSHRLKRFVY